MTLSWYIFSGRTRGIFLVKYLRYSLRFKGTRHIAFCLLSQRNCILHGNSHISYQSWSKISKVLLKSMFRDTRYAVLSAIKWGNLCKNSPRGGMCIFRCRMKSENLGVVCFTLLKFISDREFISHHCRHFQTRPLRSSFVPGSQLSTWNSYFNVRHCYSIFWRVSFFN